MKNKYKWQEWVYGGKINPHKTMTNKQVGIKYGIDMENLNTISRGDAYKTKLQIKMLNGEVIFVDNV